jgi:hypothetical protein
MKSQTIGMKIAVRVQFATNVLCVHNHKNNQVSICTTITHVALLGACMFPTTKRFIVGQSLHAYWGPGAMSKFSQKEKKKRTNMVAGSNMSVESM